MELYEQSENRTATLSFLLFPSGILQPLITRKSREMGENPMIILENLNYSLNLVLSCFPFFLR